MYRNVAFEVGAVHKGNKHLLTAGEVTAQIVIGWFGDQDEATGSVGYTGQISQLVVAVHVRGVVEILDCSIESEPDEYRPTSHAGLKGIVHAIAIQIFIDIAGKRGSRYRMILLYKINIFGGIRWSNGDRERIACAGGIGSIVPVMYDLVGARRQRNKVLALKTDYSRSHNVAILPGNYIGKIEKGINIREAVVIIIVLRNTGNTGVEGLLGDIAGVQARPHRKSASSRKCLCLFMDIVCFGDIKNIAGRREEKSPGRISCGDRCNYDQPGTTRLFLMIQKSRKKFQTTTTSLYICQKVNAGQFFINV